MADSPTPKLTTRFDDALAYAAELHRAQERKGSGIPYVGHLLSVASLVIEGGGTEDQAIAGLLHDAVEDQGGAPTLAVIRERFGDDVARIVEECSDTDEVPKPPWKPRKQQYIDHLAYASKETILVSLADKLDNARAILRDYRTDGSALWDRFSQNDPKEHLWYYRSLLNIYQRADDTWLVGELERLLDELEELINAAEA
jgi:(p)ppGpp synthase/HD superfamily hydrolase